MIKHPKYGTYTCLPSAGGLLNQPARTMQVFEVMREEWLKKLKEEIEQSLRKR